MDCALLGTKDDLRKYIVASNRRNMAYNSQVLLRFPNGFGASIIRGPFSYGGPEGLFELAVVRWTGDDFHLDYTTPITSDVLGHLAAEEVRSICYEIMALPGV